MSVHVVISLHTKENLCSGHYQTKHDKSTPHRNHSSTFSCFTEQSELFCCASPPVVSWFAWLLPFRALSFCVGMMTLMGEAATTQGQEGSSSYHIHWIQIHSWPRFIEIEGSEKHKQDPSKGQPYISSPLCSIVIDIWYAFIKTLLQLCQLLLEQKQTCIVQNWCLEFGLRLIGKTALDPTATIFEFF